MDDTKKHLDDVQEEFFQEVGHKPHSVRQLLAFCQQKSTGHKFKDINKWWPTRPEPEEKPLQEPINPFVSRDFTLNLNTGLLTTVNEQEEDDDDNVPTPRIGAQIQITPTPNDMPIRAPQWSTMESMQFEFDLDDLSDDEDNELENESGSYETHHSWFSGQDHEDRDSENEDSRYSDHSQLSVHSDDHGHPELAQNDEDPEDEKDGMDDADDIPLPKDIEQTLASLSPQLSARTSLQLLHGPRPLT